MLSALALSLAACSSKGKNPSTSGGGADSTSQGGDSQSSQGGNSTSDQGGEIAVTSVTLDQATLALEVGKSANLTATVLPANASNTKVSWSSSDATIASVSNLGKVTAAKVGTATITAASQSNPAIKAECVVTVSEEGGKYGSVNKPKTVAQILAIAAEECKNKDDRTAEPVYVKGIVWKAPTNKGTFSQGIYLKDALTDEKDLWVYSANHDELKEPYKNDEVVLHGYLMNYNGTIEVSNVTIDGAKVYPAIDTVTRGTSSITYNVEHGSVNAEAPKSGKNMSEFSFTVTPEANYKVDRVTVNGTEVAAEANGSYKGIVKGDTVVQIDISEEGVTVQTVEMAYPGGPNDSDTTNMVEGNNAAKVGLDASIFEVTSTNTTGIYAGLNKNGEIRLYDNRKAEDVSQIANGTTLTVSSRRVTITKIVIELTSTSVGTMEVKAGDQVVTASDGQYQINNGKFSIQNVSRIEGGASASGKQVIIKKVTISYTENAAVAATAIAVAPKTLTLKPEQTGLLKATLTPENATDVIAWETSDASKVTVAQDGTVTAVAEGSATITAKVSDTIKDTAVVTVEAAEVINYGTAEAPLTIAEAKAVLDKTGTNESKQPLFVKGIISTNKAFSATYHNGEVWLQSDDGTVAKAFEAYSCEIDASLNYQGDPAVDELVGYEVVVTGYGKIYGTTYELTNVTRDGNRINPKIISMEKQSVPATGIALDKTSAEIEVAEELQLKATLSPAGAEGTVVWSSSAEGVATVDQNGKVVGVAAGTATITAQVSETIKAECAVTVKAAAQVQPLTEAVTLNYSNLTGKGAEITSADVALSTVGQGNSHVKAVEVTKVYDGNGSGGAYANTAGFLKTGTGSVAGQIKLTLDALANKVEILCHDFYKKNESNPTNSNTFSVNGSATQLAPYNENATFGTLTFDLAEDSKTITIDINKRAFIKEIKISYAQAAVAQPTGAFRGLAKTAAGTFIPVNMVLAADSVALDINGAAATVTSYDWDNKDTLSIVTDGAYGTITAKFAENVFTITSLTGAAASQLDLTYAVKLSGNCQFLNCEQDTATLQNMFLRRKMGSSGWEAANADDKIFSSENGKSGKGLSVKCWADGKIALALKNDLNIPAKNIKSVGCWIYNPSSTEYSTTLYFYKAAGYQSNQQAKTFTLAAQSWTFCQCGISGLLGENDTFYNFQFYTQNVNTTLVFDNFCLYM